MKHILFRPDGLMQVGNRLYTNKHKVPLEVVYAILKDRYTVEGEESSDYSASRLVQPIQKTALEERYKDDLKISDVMDLFYSFIGSVAHQVLEESWHENMGGVVERRLYTEICGEVLSGKMDRYIDGQIKDYKNTKVYKIQKADYQEWAIQQNIYAYLCRVNGWEVTQIQIIAFLLDWKEGESTYKQNYPDCAVQVIPIRLWSEEETKEWITNRIKNIQAARELNDEELSAKYPCSNEERWKNYQGTAVMKVGGKKASFLKKPEDGTTAENYEACRQYVHEKKLDYSMCEIVERWSAPKRCVKWCPAANHCPQYQKELAYGMLEDDEESND